MRKALLFTLVLALAAAAPAIAAGPEPKTDEQKTLYAIGVAVSRSLAPFNLTEAELDMVKAGLTDGLTGKESKVDLQTYGPKIQELQKSRLAVVAMSVVGVVEA